MPGESILIVEDNPADRKLARVLLAKEGYRVFTATSAAEALALVPVVRPGLMLIDVLLPDMDGIELTRQLKAHAATRGIVVVVVTAHASKWNRETALAAGCAEHFAKPLNTRTLAEAIAGYLRCRQRSTGCC